jgi:hypothetical protein
MKTTPGKGPEPAGLKNAPAIVLVVGSSTGIGMTSVYPPPIGGAVWPAPIVGETSIELVASAKPATDVKKLRFTKVSSAWGEAGRVGAARVYHLPTLRHAGSSL